MDFPFDEELNTAIITCCHVLNDNKPILHVSHDAEDGMWQFLCGEEHQEEDAKVVSIYEIYKRDNTIAALADLPLGYSAERIATGDNWTARKK